LEFKDYYRTLGVARDATADEVKRAYRKLARKYHPDVSREADAGRRMAEINEANTVLSDPEKRAAYDRLGQYQPGQEFRPPPGWDSGFEFSGRGRPGAEGAGFSDFFAEIFGDIGNRAQRGGAARGRHHRHAANARGEDHHARIELDLEDSFTGASRQISLRAPRLGDDGHVRLDEHTISVKIPRGIRAGQVIRLGGKGEPGTGSGEPGDLLLEVQFRPHPRFRPDGRDLLLTLPVAPWEAALGSVVPVEVPGGTINMRIPAGAGAGTMQGKRLRVPGKGLPSDPPGDLYIDIRIVTPPADTPRARKLYETMAKEFAFDPRKEPAP
jgi:curved DNA-binding protein